MFISHQTKGWDGAFSSPQSVESVKAAALPQSFDNATPNCKINRQSVEVCHILKINQNYTVAEGRS